MWDYCFIDKSRLVRRIIQIKLEYLARTVQTKILSENLVPFQGYIREIPLKVTQNIKLNLQGNLIS